MGNGPAVALLGPAQLASAQALRILHVIDSLEFGGAEKVTVDLANAMADDHQVAICCVKTIGDLATTLKPAVGLHCIGKGEGNDIKLPWKLRKIVKQHRADVIHLHDWGAFLEAGLAASTCPGTRLIQTCHGPYREYAPDWKSTVKKHLRHALELLLTHRYFRIVTVADSVKRDMIKRRIRSTKLTTIHNGIDPQGNDNSTGPASPAGTPALITVARLSPVKNQAMMLDAFAKVLTDFPNAKLSIVGDGPSLPELQDHVKALGIIEQVIFTGFRNDAAALLGGADLFLLSSNYEGISISALEAMRAGLPVVATDVGGMSETVVDGETGLLSPPGDTAAFADAIKSLCADSELRHRMGKMATNRLIEKFSIDAMSNQYLKVYGG